MNIFRRLAAAAARWRANATWKPDCAACYHYGVAVAHTEEDGNDLANRGDTYQAMAHYAEANRVREAWHEHRVADHTPADA